MINMSKEEIKNVYEQYMNLDCKEVDKLITNLAIQKNCLTNTILKRIENYAFSLEGEYNSFLEKKESIRVSKLSYINIINKILEEKIQGIEINYHNYGTKHKLEQLMDKYLKIFPNKKAEIDLIFEEVSRFYEQVTEEDYGCRVLDIDSEYKGTTRYVREIIDILNCKTDLEAIIYMRKLKFTKKHMETILANFKKYYSNSDEYIEKLIDIFKKYDEFVNHGKTNLAEKDNYKNKIISELVNSGYSIEEFCHHNLRYSISDIKKLFNCDEEKINRVISNKQNSVSFIEQLKYIVDQISNNESYDIVDYHMDTKLNFRDFATLTRKYNLYNDKVSYFLSTMNNNSRNRINKESELRCNIIINERIITLEEKEQAFLFLEQNEIPINTYTYRILLNKILNNEINFEIKKLVK